jgi:signal transduction histidine kinase
VAFPVSAPPAVSTRPAVSTPQAFWRRLVWSRDGFVNSTMFGLCFVASLAASHGLLKGWDGYPAAFRILDVVTGGTLLVGIWWRKRWPVGFAVAALIVGSFSTLGSCVILVAVFNVAVHRRWPVAAVVAALGALQLGPYLLIYPQSGELAMVIFSTILIAALTGWGMFVRARRQLVASLMERAERAEAEVTLRADQARRGERERMAREMHDVLAHRLSLLSVHAGALEFRPDAPSDEIAKAAGVIRANAHDALEDLRSVIGVLREDGDTAVPDRPQPTLSDLPALIEESRQAGMAVTFVVDALIDAAPPAVGRSVYRIVQEGLTNSRKHAPSSPVRVDLGGGRGRGLTVTVTTQWIAPSTGPAARDPEGRLLQAMPGSGTGLIGLRERTTLAGGWLDYGPTPAGEYKLKAWLPWPVVDAPAPSKPVTAGG